MRTRNARTPTPKKAAAETTSPVASTATTPKSTPRSRSARGAGKQSTPKSVAAAAAASAAATAAAPAILDPSLELQVGEEAALAEEKTLDSAAKHAEKKARGKAKSPLGRAKEAAVAPAIPDPNPELQAGEEATQAADKTPDSAVILEEKKAGGKSESPLGGAKAVEDSAVIEEAEEVKELDQQLAREAVHVKEETTEEDKEAVIEEVNPEDTEVDVDAAGAVRADMESAVSKSSMTDAKEDYQMVEYHLEEVFEEPVEEELTGNGEGGGGQRGKAVEREGGEEGAQAEEVERIEISDMAKKRKIKKEQEVFVGGLDRDAVEEDIRKAFEQIGEVVEVRLHKDFVTNKNKGFAFVTFANKEQAARALGELKNPVIHGKRCGIAPSEDNDTIFLGNICNTWTKEAIKRKLQDYGVDRVENITLVPDTQNEGLSRGFAFLEFSCHADAMLAYKRLQKPDVVFGHPERTAKVAFAEPLREPDPEVMGQVKSVFVDGLPPYWDEDRVKEQFKGYGEIERVVLARNMSSAKRNDFGFVNFTTHEAAVACAEGIDNTDLGDDGKSKIKARARLANPLPKTQAVKGGMSGGFRIGYTGLNFNRFGRGSSRGRFFPHRAGFHGGRGFNTYGRGRGGRFPFVADTGFESSSSNFIGRRPFGFRGGRWAHGTGRHGAFDRGRGRGFLSRRPPFPPERDFGGPLGASYVGEDPYMHGGTSRHGFKRPFSMMDDDSGYFQPGSRLRPWFDYSDPLSGGSRYRDSIGMGGVHSRDYFGSDYGGSTYSSLYRGEHSGSGYYY